MSAISPKYSVFVSASAGTGKTKTLIDRLVNLLLAGTKPSKILCLTFTKAAAAEILARIKQQLAYFAICAQDELIFACAQLGHAHLTPDLEYRARTLFASFLDEIEPLNIQTIHAFCQQLLSKFPLEAGINLNCNLLNENQVALLLEEAKNLLFTQLNTYPKADQALSYLSWHIKEYSIKELLAEIILNRDKLDHFFKLHQTLDHALESFHLDVNEDEVVKEFIAHIPITKQYLTILSSGGKSDIARATKLEKFLNYPKNLQIMLLLEYLHCFLTQNGDPVKILLSKKISTPELAIIFEKEQYRVHKFYQFFKNIKAINLTKAFVIFSYYIRQIYQALKTQNNSLDYDDLISLTLDLLSHNEHAEWIRYKLDGGVEHILIDEAQDNSEIQWQIINKIYEEFNNNKSIFIVGDAKQSIFSFQGAAPALFNALNKNLPDKVLRVQLNKSFRSGKQILEFVDQVFNTPEIRPLVTDIEKTILHQAHKTSEAEIEIWPLIIEEDTEEKQTWVLPSNIKQNLVETADLKLAKLIAQKLQGINPGDVLILTRRRTNFIRILIQELRKANIPTVGLDRFKLLEQPIILDLIALTNFLLCPSDDLNLAITLKSLICNVSEEELLTICVNRTATIWEKLQDSQHPQAAFLQKLQLLACNQTPFEFYFNLFESQHLQEICDSETSDVIKMFLDLVAEYESEHIPNLQLFLNFLNNSNTEIKRDLSQASDAVRIMTVHNAKGLQAPIVILTDTTSLPYNHDSIIWLNEQQLLWSNKEKYYPEIAQEAKTKKLEQEYAEYLRLLYVALTRAEDKLIICGTARNEEISSKSWYAIVKKVMES